METRDTTEQKNDEVLLHFLTNIIYTIQDNGVCVCGDQAVWARLDGNYGRIINDTTNWWCAHCVCVFVYFVCVRVFVCVGRGRVCQSI